MHRLDAAVKKASLPEAFAAEFRRSQLGVFTMENGSDASPCGQGGIDQRAEVVRMNHVKTLLKNATKAIHGAPLEALSFSERVDGDGRLQLVGVDACMPQAANFKMKALRVKAVDQVYELMLHASGFQSVDNFQDTDNFGRFRHGEGFFRYGRS